jgi:hypothetical protein
VNKKTNCRTIVPLHNFNTIPEMFEPFENLNLIVVEDMCALNPKKKKTFDINVNEKFQDV